MCMYATAERNDPISHSIFFAFDVCVQLKLNYIILFIYIFFSFVGFHKIVTSYDHSKMLHTKIQFCYLHGMSMLLNPSTFYNQKKFKKKNFSRTCKNQMYRNESEIGPKNKLLFYFFLHVNIIFTYIT